MENRKPWWILVGGRQRLGRFLAERWAPERNLVLTSSRPWEGEADWLGAMSRTTEVRTLCWNAEDPCLVTRMAADMAALAEEGISFGNALVASSTFPMASLGSWTPESLEATWRMNLSFPFLVAQALAPRMTEGGCLQFLLDTAIHRPWLKRLPYSAAKSGLASLVPGLAQVLAPRVRVVGHAIGVVMADEGSDPAFLASRSLLKRLGVPEDLDRAIRYAADSPYLTGEIMTLDGGRRWV
ncbi:SDR family oxidoreductase [Holophaga foetida]|uniref:SDR family oxidoreductase n=1 Tax=Holophaga foetida TaxID=35839 RepID=UPI0002474A3E|nr:SDR family oxidoreductase [Holophaga foetida]